MVPVGIARCCFLGVSFGGRVDVVRACGAGEDVDAFTGAAGGDVVAFWSKFDNGLATFWQ